MQVFQQLVGDQGPHIAWWQMCIRAAIIFVYAVALYRLVPRRSFAGLTPFDIGLTVILGSSLSRALTGNAPLLPTLAATILLVALHAGLATLAPRSRLVSLAIKGRPVLLIRDGKVDERAARRARLGPRDLEEELRLEGVADPAEVKEARLERNGAVSVLRRRTRDGTGDG